MLEYLVTRSAVRYRLESLPAGQRGPGDVAATEGMIEGDEEISRLVSLVRARVVCGMPVAVAMDAVCPLYAYALTARGSSGFYRPVFTRGLRNGERSVASDVGHVLRGLDAIVRVCSISGAPVSPCLDVLLRDMAERRAARDGMESAFGVPRSTARLLAVLPVLTIGLCELMGIRVGEFMLSGVAGMLCLVLGLGMYGAGMAWIHVLLRSHVAQTMANRPGNGGNRGRGGSAVIPWRQS